MTQEEKQLLLKDLCARLSYRVQLWSPIAEDNWAVLTPVVISNIMNADLTLPQVKPYLRPMSSMTDDEKKYISDKCGFSVKGPIDGKFVLVMPILASDWLIDFYNEHYLDYRGLIPMGLALEAREGMYE